MINRKKEITAFFKAIDSSNAELINFYGRRRLGKTEILKHIRNKYKDEYHVLYYVFSEKNDQTQLVALFQSLKNLFPNNDPIKQLTIANWEDFFTYIFKFDGKLIVLLDEFSNLIKVNKAIPSIIQNIWDEYNKVSKVKLLVCGSIISTMKELMAGDSSFYGRAKSMILKPMLFKDIINFIPKMSFENKIILYSLFGGIPAYLEQFTSIQNDSLKEILIKKPFAKLSIFGQEVLTELQMSIKKPSAYLQILYAIMKGKHTFSKISDFVKADTKNITKYIDVLIEIGLILRIKPFSKKKLTYYVIKDNFTKFWLQFFYPYKNELELLSPEDFVDHIVLSKLNEYMGHQFETFCKEYLQELSLKHIIPDLVLNIYNYQDEITDKSKKEKKQIEIDIIAEYISKKFLYIGECKW